MQASECHRPMIGAGPELQIRAFGWGAQAPLRSAPPVCGTTGGQVFGATNGDLDLRAGMVDGSFAKVHQHRTGAPEAPAHPMSRQRGRPLALVPRPAIFDKYKN